MSAPHDQLSPNCLWLHRQYWVTEVFRSAYRCISCLSIVARCIYFMWVAINNEEILLIRGFSHPFFALSLLPLIQLFFHFSLSSSSGDSIIIAQDVEARLPFSRARKTLLCPFAVLYSSRRALPGAWSNSWYVFGPFISRRAVPRRILNLWN